MVKASVYPCDQATPRNLNTQPPLAPSPPPPPVWRLPYLAISWVRLWQRWSTAKEFYPTYMMLAKPDYGNSSNNIDHMLTQETKHRAKATEDKPMSQKELWKKDYIMNDDRNKILLIPDLSWEEKVVFILNMVRRREITEYDPKKCYSSYTRFCEHNIAFLDLDKESDFKREPWRPDNTCQGLDVSINIISIKVAQSDVPFPINIYGTVLARDQVDYKCVYLFKRQRDNPQHITSADDTLNLTGPYRALAGIDRMYFEFNLKIKGEDGVDKDFSKGIMEMCPFKFDDMCPRTRSIESFLSEVKMEFAFVFNALEASVEVNILSKKRTSHFYGKVTAGDYRGEILLYDSKVAGTETKLDQDGAVSLTRSIVAVPWGRCLVLSFKVPRVKQKKYISFAPCDSECSFKIGPYFLQVKIKWSGILRKGHKNVLSKIGRALLII